MWALSLPVNMKFISIKMMAYKMVNTTKIGSEILVDTRHSTVKSSKYKVIRISSIIDKNENKKIHTLYQSSYCHLQK